MALQLEFPGVSYPGRHKIPEILAELRRQEQSFKDYIVSTDKMGLVQDAQHGLALSFDVMEAGNQLLKNYNLPLSRRVWLQLMNWLGLRTDSRLFKRLRWGTDDDRGITDVSRFWPTFRELVNDHFNILKSRRLIRTLGKPDGEWYVRAFLSNSYLVIPNGKLFMHVADRIEQRKAEIWDARLSEDSLYLYCVAPELSTQVRADRTFNADRFVGDAGDVMNAAVQIRNSETGQGGCEVKPAIVSKVTGDFIVGQTTLSVRHLGARQVTDMLLSESTLSKKHSLIFDEIKDYIDSVFNPDKFEVFLRAVQDSTQDELQDPAAAAAAVRVVYDLTQDRETKLLKWLLDSGDRSRYGLARAVSRAAAEEQSADEAAHLEEISGHIVEKQTALNLARAFNSKAEARASRAALAAAQVARELTSDGDI